MNRFLLIAVFFLGACAPRVLTRHPVATKPSVKPADHFSYPLKGAKLLSRFGPRGRNFHLGVDLQRNRKGGDPVVASRPGKVTAAKWMRGYGNIIAIYHQDGYSTRYAHLKSFTVKPGQRVERQQQIGVVGQTGRASAPHLHFEVLTPDGKFIDPLIFLN